MKKGIICAALALMVVLSMTGVVAADNTETDTTDVSVTVADEFTWTAPADFVLAAKDDAVSQDLEVTKLVMPSNKKLQIVCASTNNFKLVNATETGSDLTYELTSEAFSEGTHTLYFTEPVTGASVKKAISATLKSDLPTTRSGSWTDTLTFTATIVTI